MALAGVASAEIGRTETLWTMQFGTDINTTNNDDYIVTGSYAPTSVSGVNGKTGDNYVTTVGTNGSQAVIKWDNGTGMSWSEDNWEFEVVFTLPSGFKAGNEWPAIVEITTDRSNSRGSNYGVRISPYVTDSNKLNLDGHVGGKTTTTYTLSTDTEYTATLSFYEGVLTMKLDGDVVVTATSFPNDLTGIIKDTPEKAAIKQICLGGRQDNSAAVQVNIHSMSAYKIGVVPEPTTATLSLLALCGLAARRRRK